jgi:hypothetical protein
LWSWEITSAFTTTSEGRGQKAEIIFGEILSDLSTFSSQDHKPDAIAKAIWTELPFDSVDPGDFGSKY